MNEKDPIPMKLFFSVISEQPPATLGVTVGKDAVLTAKFEVNCKLLIIVTIVTTAVVT